MSDHKRRITKLENHQASIPEDKKFSWVSTAAAGGYIEYKGQLIPLELFHGLYPRAKVVSVGIDLSRL